jgi:predicted metalloprotease with PDZ domain
MTEAIQVPAPTSSAPLPQTQVELFYEVAMPQPESHLFEVTLRVKGWQLPVLDLKMPVWTPGSYLVREYSRHLQDFSVAAGLAWHKVSKNHWQVETSIAHFTGSDIHHEQVDEITICYRVYANDLTVRTNHLDGTHGYFNGAALFFFVPGWERSPIQVKINPPHADWRTAVMLPEVAPNTFVVADFDQLVDSPFEVGIHQRYEFEVLGKLHEYVFWGTGNYDAAKLITDTKKIIETEAEMLGGLPYERYLFLVHLSGNGFGGLEHKDSCTLNYHRLGFRDPEKYRRFMQLVAHEFFHLWNVKRIRPKALEVFDYEQENYTPSLWFSEGTTSFYDLTFPFRSGLYDAKTYLQQLGKEITRYLTTPGRKVQPLAESSFDAWIKLYRRDSNSDNSQISYYLKGEMVSLLLDLLIRAKHQNKRSLDQVVQHLWQEFGQSEVGFTPNQLKETIEAVAEQDLSDFFHRYLETTEALPFETYLQPFGLQLKPEDISNAPPYLGMTVKRTNGRDMVTFVEMDSPARQAGIDPEDELLAIDGLRVKADQLVSRLKDYGVGDRLQVTIFHQDELKTVTVTLESPRPSQYEIIPVEHPSAEQRFLLQGWLGIG